MFPYEQALGLGWLDTHGSLNLTESSPAQSFEEPLTLSEVLTYLKIDTDDPGQNAEIEGMISAARGQAEIMQGRDLVRKQWDLSLDYWLSNRIELRSPLVSVDLFTRRDSSGATVTLAENTDYIVDSAKQPGIVMPPYNQTWPAFTPWPSSAILVRFTSGMAGNSAWWQGQGRMVKNGMLLLISAWTNNKLPFVKGLDATTEYPFAVTTCLSQGANPRVR